MKLRKALFSDVDAAAAMYRDVIGVNNSVWDENYPTHENAEDDFRDGRLYIFENDGEIIGACSVEYENELDEFDFWKIRQGSLEISRIVIARKHQGKGLAKVMVKLFIKELAEQGCSSIHLLAAKSNPAAIKTYKSIGFEFVGECFAFGHDYYAAEYITGK